MADAAGPILVVDHDEDVRLFVGALFEAAGFPVAEAESGESALALADDVRPRLALVDVFLPGLSGYELCHRLKTEFHVPVVLVSRPARESLDHLAGMLLGADACVAKPFLPEDLLDRVRELLVSQVEAA
jgi:two-component system alkaline phosphatase synthesis response regulator PhoP